MIAIDVLLTSIVIVASVIVFRFRTDIRHADAFAGVGCILGGLWIITLFYIFDFYTMIVMPMSIGNDRAMQVMAMLHLDYSWYIQTVGALLVFSGLVLTILRFAQRFRRMETRTEELLENENILDSIFENLPVGLLIKDQDHVIERANRTYLSWYGVALEKMVGNRFDHIEGFQSDTDARIMNAQEDEVLATGKLVNREVERYLLDGKPHMLSISKFPVFDREGRITKVGSVTIDLTDIAKAEEAMRDALSEAEEATRAKSQFIATMSHEFRTPLNAIIGFSEMLKEEYFGPLGARNYKEYAGDINGSGRHMLDLVNDILDFSAIEASKRQMEMEVFSFDEILRDSIRNVERQLAEKGLHLKREVPDDLAPMYADKRSIYQIMLNLLTNAVKFTNPGGSITVHAECDDERFTFSVSDTGIGIDASQLDTITEPFAQTHSNAHIAGTGTGLGLTIVKSLVEAHKGTLVIDSVLGEGTSVTISLPNNAAPAGHKDPA